jgi:S-(hydroxymethyl)glutathione dehydrogenase / alcohol dehydrogenase
MKAAVCYEFGKPLVIEDLKIGEPTGTEVKVRLGATAICHSDIHAMEGAWWDPLPLLLGHEAAGYVEEVGKDVTMVKPGDHVIVTVLASCKKCYNCLSGAPYMCLGQFPMDKTPHLWNKKGQPVIAAVRMGAFAEYLISDETQLIPIPNEVPIDSAALIACGVITGFFSVVNQPDMKPLSSAAIIGCGGVGLNAIQGAAFRGAYPVIAVDVIDSKLEQAKKFGATHTINSKNVDPIKAAAELTGGRGPDWVFVTVGSTKAALQAIQMSSQRGHTVIVGLPEKSEMLSFSPLELAFFKERTISGAFMGSTIGKVQIPKLVDLYLAKRLKLDELISGRYPLEKINEAVAEVKKGGALRNIIVFK